MKSMSPSVEDCPSHLTLQYQKEKPLYQGQQKNTIWNERMKTITVRWGYLNQGG